MTRSLTFWVIMLVWIVFQFAVFGGLAGRFAAASPLVEFLLFLLLGWQVYGPPVRGQ